MTYVGVFTALSATLSVFLSRAFGAKDIGRSKSVIFHGQLISVIIGFLFGAVSVIFAEPLLDLVGANTELKSEAIDSLK
jgi:Na+-driven multidrug efflux pump